MYAVIKTGGKQYKVAPGGELVVERLPGEAGDMVELSEVLLLESDGNVQVGKPFVAGAAVQGQIVGQLRGEKKIIYKKIRRHGKRLKKGHRQELTRIKVVDIKSA